MSFDQNTQIDLATLTQTLGDCAGEINGDVWSELVDRGTYDLVYSAPEGSNDRELTGIAHLDWAQKVPLRIGTLFGFRAAVLAGDARAGETIQIVTYFPDGPNGRRPPDVTTKQLTPGATEAALFLIGSEGFMLPGIWRIELRHAGRVLAAQRFELTVPTPD